jgi:type I restriction enzyme R subunit
LKSFTGTSLLKSDKSMSLETFGSYIDTPYWFDETVEDGVMLDLRYETREIEQCVTSPAKIDAWFEAKAKGLALVAKASQQQLLGTLQRVLSSRDRITQIASDIIMAMDGQHFPFLSA